VRARNRAVTANVSREESDTMTALLIDLSSLLFERA